MQCPEEKKLPALDEEPHLPEDGFGDGQPYDPSPVEEPLQDLPKTDRPSERTSPEPVQDLPEKETLLEEKTSAPASREEVAHPPLPADPASSAAKHVIVETIDLSEEPVPVH